MMKSTKANVGQRRTFLIIASFLLVTVLVLGLAQWTAAEDDKPEPGIPDSSDIYKDRMPTEEEIGEMVDPVARYLALETLSGEQLLGSDLGESSKDANRDEVPAGSRVSYRIFVRNSGDEEVVATMLDALPNGLSYVSHERVDSEGLLPGVPEFDVVGDEITWQGNISGGGFAELEIVARVASNFKVGNKISNTAEISGGGQTIEVAADITVLEKTEVPLKFMPYIEVGIPPNPPAISDLSATRPNSQNQFRLSWTGGSEATHYVVEQALDPSFNAPIRYDSGVNTFLDLQPQPSWQNDFYFRVRSFVGLVGGPWSNTVNVVGAYYDEFDDPNSGWEVVRTTNLDHVNDWYEIIGDDDWLILEIGDRWDWGIVSSLAKAPEPPYVIEYEGKFAQTPNEVAMGIVFAGDYPGNTCPDKSSVDGWYQHDLCFNHFYNPQFYWAGEALHLIWQRVDELVWCPDCEGSPMKRRGDTDNLGQMNDVDNDDWNRHRIEVREGRITYYAGERGNSELTFQHEYNDTRWIDDPLFGVFAYAGEYTSSVARFEYFSIMPLDN